MMILRDIKSKMILTMLLIVLSAQGVWAEKATPTMEISPLDSEGFLDNSYKNVYPNWGSFTAPTVSLYTGPSDKRTSVLSKYQITYYIDGHEGDTSFETDDKGRQITTDDADDKTGTTITRFYGDVVVGPKSGTVTIKVVAKVKEAYANDYAETVSATYKFNINKVKPTANVSPTSLSVGVWHTETYNYGKWFFTNTSAMIPVPNTAISITHNEYTQDLSKVYDVSFAPKAGSEGLLEVKTDGASQYIGADNYIVAKLTDVQKHQTNANGDDAVQDPYKTQQSATLVATFTPKSGYEATYNSVSVDIPVTIQDFDKSSKLTATMTLDGVSATTDKDAVQSESNTLHWSRWNDRTAVNEGVASHHLPKPTITGSNGADLSNHPQLSICYFAVEDNTYYDDCQRNYLNPWGEVWNAGESTLGNLNRTTNIERRLNKSETLYNSNKPGLLKIGVFAYLHDDGPAPEATNNTALDNWYVYTDETTVGNLVPAEYANTNASTTYRRITDVQYFYIDVMKRAPELVFDPDPTGVHYSTADEINMNNRFELSGKIGDENDGTAGTLTYGPQWGAGDDTFWYSFEFDADAGIVVNNWPHYDRMFALSKTEPKQNVEPLGYDWNNNGAPQFVIYEKKTIKDEWGNDVEVDDTEKIAKFTADEAAAYNAQMGTSFSAGDNKDVRSLIGSYRYWSVKGFGTDNLWSIQFTEAGDKQITYTIYPFNHGRWDKGTTKVQTYIIDAAKQTKLHIDPKELVASISQTGFVEPEVWVTDAFDEEVSKDYSFSFEIQSTTETGETKTSVANDGGDGTGPKHEVTIGNSVGDVVVKVTATTDNAKYDTGCHTLTDTYTIHILNTNEDTNPLYEIISSKDDGAVRNEGNTGTNDNDYAKDKVMGKMHFIKTGQFYAGYTISGVPGLDIRFGKFDGSVWNVKEDSSDDIGSYDNANDIVGGVSGQHNKFIGDDTPVVLNEEGIATGGHFYEFYAHTNGFLIVDARWEANHTYVLIDFDNPEMKYEYTPTALSKGDYTFPMALLEDHSYHLYCTTGGQINMHGLSFNPAFINSSSDTAPVTTGSAFLNGFPNVPTLAVAEMPTVEYSIDENDPNKAAAEVNASTGAVTPKALTFASTPNYVTIHGKVNSQTKDNAFKIPYYNLVIADIPTYRLGDQKDTSGEGKDGFGAGGAIFVPQPGTRVTTYNIPTPIEMTYGGWENTYTQRVPDGSGEKIKENISDGFKAKTNAEIAGFTSTDTQFNKYLDGFTWSNVATQNPSDERGRTNYKNYLTDATKVADVDQNTDTRDYYMNTFTLPAHGAYWRFEPRTSGYLFVYLVQNGICSYTGDPHSLQNTDKRYYGLDWKPLYIVDEAGLPVSTVTDLGDMNQSVQDFLGNAGSYTKGLIRCDKNDANVKKAAEAVGTPTADFSFLWQFLKEQNEAGFDVDYKGSNDNKATLHDNIISSWKGAGNTQNVFQDPESKGYSMISKAYVRYAIRVKAGKSYWVFQNASKPNLCGFGFVPDGFNGAPANNNGPAPVAVTIQDTKTLAESLTAAGGAANIYDKPANVTYAGREFKNKHWTSICLPFAVSEYNFKKIFGKNAKIFTYEKLSNDNKTVHFVQHNYRMMEAGRPYFIYPDYDEATAIDAGGKTGIIFEGVTFEANKPAGSDISKDAQKPLIISKDGFEFVGTYDGEQMNRYSYYINGKLWRVNKEGGLPCGHYRAYMKNPTSNEALARLGGSTFEEPYEDTDTPVTPTTIKGITDGTIVETESMAGLKGIYTIEGRQISTNANAINNLPAGVYIINGQKQIIK
jgi:hypothetical protein